MVPVEFGRFIHLTTMAALRSIQLNANFGDVWLRPTSASRGTGCALLFNTNRNSSRTVHGIIHRNNLKVKLNTFQKTTSCYGRVGAFHTSNDGGSVEINVALGDGRLRIGILYDTVI